MANTAITCPGSGTMARSIYTSTQPKWFNQRFGTCGTCGGPVRIKKGTNLSTQHKERT